MQRPNFGGNTGNTSILRTYGRSQKKPEVKKPLTYTQMLDEDLSLLMEIDLDEINNKSKSNNRKRSIDELQSDSVFKSPHQALKRPKVASPASTSKESKPLAPEPQEPPPEEETYSQQLIDDCDLRLTQIEECCEMFKGDPSLKITINEETNSQYIERSNRSVQDIDPDGTIDEALLDELFNYAQPEESLKLEDENEEPEVVDQAQREKQEVASIVELINSGGLNSPLNTSVKSAKSAQFSASKRKFSRPVLRPVSTNPFPEKGPFFGLTRKHRDFILKTKNIESLYEWQEECLNLRAIHDRTNLIYALPTSGGKTLVAEIAMFREVILRDKNVIFVLPFVSIVQEKVQDLTPFALEFNFLVEEYCAGKGSIPPVKRRNKRSIYICTMEKAQILFDSLAENGRLSELGLIVVDELHMLGDKDRGYALECLLTKTLYQQETRIQVIGMSATISNLGEIAEFLRADVYTRNFRPVELKEFVKIGPEIFSIDPKSKVISDALKKERNFGDEYKAAMVKMDPDHVAGLLLEVSPKEQSLIFCATKKNCEDVAILASNLFPNECLKYKRDEKENLMEAIKADANGQLCPILRKTIPYGIAYHHSGLTSEERKHLEEAYRLNIICIICCTSTLAAGVNLPAKRVIIRSPYVGSNFMSLTTYKQMVGRAGRAGHCAEGESILICQQKDFDKLANLLCSKMDETTSAFIQNSDGKRLKTLILNLIGTKMATTVKSLEKFFQCSLLSVQIGRIETNLKDLIEKCVGELLADGALSIVPSSNQSKEVSFRIDEHEIFSGDSFEVSKLGKAAVNAGMSLEDAKFVENDLHKAQKSLVLTQCLHLLFIVAPLEMVDQIKPDGDLILRLDGSFAETRRVVGISEGLLMRFITRPGSIKDEENLLIRRFYVAMILLELWQFKFGLEVAKKFNVPRGTVYGLLSPAASRAFSIFRFCQDYEEFWIFKEILEQFSKRLAYCCSTELLPLMELPAVKIGRAKMMFSAGLKTIEDVAALSPSELVQMVKNVNMRQAEQIIKGAKHSMKEKIDTCQERLEEMKQALKPKKKTVK